MRIERVRLYRLQVPLKVPYKLSLGDIKAFDTVLVEATNDEGRSGWGEATYLTGYTDEEVGQSWKLACGLGEQLAGKQHEDAHAVLAPHFATAPFTATAFNTAIEMLQRHPLLSVETAARVKLLGLVNSMSESELEKEIDALIGAGYDTLKVKVGFDAEADSGRVRTIQRVVGGRAKIRLDANQGYSRDEGRRFAAGLDPEGIELLEQPCAAGDWDAACAVKQVSPVPMMLDESIYGIKDIARAAELKAADYIKVKLMKLGGLSRLEKALKFIQECGMEPVLGNGVACEPGCWMEACVARTTIHNAGEMNGFLKPRAPLLLQPLKVEYGAVMLEPGFGLRMDTDAIARVILSQASFPQ